MVPQMVCMIEFRRGTNISFVHQRRTDISVEYQAVVKVVVQTQISWYGKATSRRIPQNSDLWLRVLSRLLVLSNQPLLLDLLPPLHLVDHLQVDFDGLLHPWRGRNRLEDVRLTALTRLEIINKVLPTAFIQCIPNTQEHVVLRRKLEPVSLVIRNWLHLEPLSDTFTLYRY